MFELDNHYTCMQEQNAYMDGVIEILRDSCLFSLKSWYINKHGVKVTLIAHKYNQDSNIDNCCVCKHGDMIISDTMLVYRKCENEILRLKEKMFDLSEMDDITPNKLKEMTELLDTRYVRYDLNV